MADLTVVFDHKERKKGKLASSSARSQRKSKSGKTQNIGNAHRGLHPHRYHTPAADYACTGPCDPAEVSNDRSDTDDSISPKFRSPRSSRMNNNNLNTTMKKKKRTTANLSNKSNRSSPDAWVHGWLDDDHTGPRNSRKSLGMPKKAPKNLSNRSSGNAIMPVPRPGRVATFDDSGVGDETWNNTSNDCSIGGNNYGLEAMQHISNNSGHQMSNMNTKKEENKKKNQQVVSICARIARFTLIGI